MFTNEIVILIIALVTSHLMKINKVIFLIATVAVYFAVNHYGFENEMAEPIKQTTNIFSAGLGNGEKSAAW